MTPNEGLKELADFCGGEPTLSMTLAAYAKPVHEYILQRLELGKSLAGMFRSVLAAELTKGAKGLHLREFQHGHKLNDDEAFVMPLEALGETSAVIEALRTPGNLDAFEPKTDFLNDLKFYALTVADGYEEAVVIRSYGRSRVLRQGGKFAAYFSDGAYEKVEENALLFDERVDVAVWKDEVFVFNESQFMRIFRVADALRIQTENAVKKMASKFPVANLDAFISACTGQMQMMSKASRIPDKEYFKNLTMKDVKGVIEAFDLDLQIVKEDGKESLVFDPSVETRWLILKVLDDDYLNSDMTKLQYEVNSKLEH